MGSAYKTVLMFLLVMLALKLVFSKVTMRHIDTFYFPESFGEDGPQPPKLDEEVVEQLVVDEDNSIIYTVGE